jgi:hypothetical protein
MDVQSRTAGTNAFDSDQLGWSNAGYFPRGPSNADYISYESSIVDDSLRDQSTWLCPKKPQKRLQSLFF